MAIDTYVRRDSESYRRGVIFGLTIAEVLLLMVFCILLFLKLVSDRLNEEEKKFAETSQQLTDTLELNRELENENVNLSNMVSALRSQFVSRPETIYNTNFAEMLYLEALKLEATNPEKVSEILSNINKNPQVLDQVRLSTIDEWEELTTLAQFSVSEEEYIVLNTLNEEQRENFLANVELASNKTPNELAGLKSNAEILNEGNINWPPIISLSEAKDYSFNVGSAILAPQFQQALNGSIADQILEILNEYDADVIEVIGHTDPQPMSSTRTTNLDFYSVSYLDSDSDITLRARDNAGLGYSRALSVTKELMNVPSLQGYTILPYSAAQMITPDEELQTSSNNYDESQLRRIEIRVRRRQAVEP